MTRKPVEGWREDMPGLWVLDLTERRTGYGEVGAQVVESRVAGRPHFIGTKGEPFAGTLDAAKCAAEDAAIALLTAGLAVLGHALIEFAEGKAGLTVGSALADPRVQDGSYVVEYRTALGSWCHARWHADELQERVIHGRHDRRRDWHTVASCPTMIALPCRLIRVEDMDADPATRGEP